MLRHTWVAAAACVALAAAAGWSGGDAGASFIAAASVALLLSVTLRFGILPGTLIVVFTTLAGTLPLTSDLSAWYARRGLTVVALTLALAIWSFRNALGGRKVLSERFLDA